MSYVVAGPEGLAAAASDIAGIGSSIGAANAAAALQTTEVVASASDQVSALVASFFSAHGADYQQLGAQLTEAHDQFVQKLTATASAYEGAEAGAVQTLLGAAQAPAQAVQASPLLGSNPIAAPVAAAIGEVQQLLLPGGGGLAAITGASPIRNLIANSALALRSTGLLAANAAPAATNSIGDAIKNFYNFVEPYVQYGFELASYAVGWVPWIGILSPQIMFVYNLFEPIVQSGLFNIVDWLGGSISFMQGWSNFWSATTGSINYFINTEINWILGFLPPLPPWPPNFALA